MENIQTTEQFKNFCPQCTEHELVEELTEALTTLLEITKALKPSYFWADLDAQSLNMNNEYCCQTGYSRLVLQMANKILKARCNADERSNSEINKYNLAKITKQSESPSIFTKKLVNSCSYCVEGEQTEELTEAFAALLGKEKVLKQSYSEQCQQVKESQPNNTKGLPDLKSIFPIDSKLKTVFQFIEENYHQPISVRDVAKFAGYSPAYLTDFVSRKTTKSIHRWIVERRMLEARSLLLETDEKVHQIATKVGYPDPGHFNRQFRQLYSMPPKMWRTKYRQKLYTYAVAT